MSTRMSAMKKISRARRRFIAGLFDNAWQCVYIATGEKKCLRPCGKEELAPAFADNPKASLYWWGHQSYTIKLDATHWYNFESFAPDSSTALKYAQRIVVNETGPYVRLGEFAKF